MEIGLRFAWHSFFDVESCVGFGRGLCWQCLCKLAWELTMNGEVWMLHAGSIIN